MSNDFQHINTAPKDGTVILTDCGLVKWVEPEWEGDKDGWAHVFGDSGTIINDTDYGTQFACPVRWVPVPEWMKA